MSSVSGIVHVHWPLWTIYPCAALFFWITYSWVLPVLSRLLMPVQYASFNTFNERCWRSNICSLLHTSLAVSTLSVVFFTDRAMLHNRLLPHGNQLLYVDISLSLGYFSLALPTSILMSKAGLPYGSRVMVLHHCLVVMAQLVFLLTQYPSFYMAASGVLFELTNVFFIPHVLMLQLGIDSTHLFFLVNGILLVAVYTLGRIFVCSVLAVLSFADLLHFSPPHPFGWIAALIGLGCFYGLLIMSWYWYVQQILPALHRALQGALGDTYYHAYVPKCLRTLAWRNLSSQGRAHSRALRDQRGLLRELRKEAAEMATTL